MDISVVGLGKLGAPLAVLAHNAGHAVIGVDKRAEVVDAIHRGKDLLKEPGYHKELIEALDEGFRAIMSVSDAVRRTKMTFVVVPTPSRDDGNYSLEYLAPVLQDIATAISQKDSFHTVVVVSTVLPGATRAKLYPAMTSRCQPDLFDLVYSPEFIALGSVMEDMAHPDMVLIGTKDGNGCEVVEDFYASITQNVPRVHVMSWENAELAKLALNAMLTVRITYANMIAKICERMEGGDSDRVTRAMQDDTRIGRGFFSGGSAYGGPCLPRDNRALGLVLKSVKMTPTLPLLIDLLNTEESARVASAIEGALAEKGSALKGKHVAVLGIAYKRGTQNTEDSAGVRIANELQERGAIVRVWDPVGAHEHALDLQKSIRKAQTPTDALKDATAVVLATPDPLWAEILAISGLEGSIIIDCWRILAASPKNRLIQLGIGPRNEWNLLSAAWKSL